MKKIVCLLLAVLMVMSSTSCKSSKKNPSNQTIFYNLAEDPNSLDPQVAENSASEIVITNIFEGLTRIDEDNKVIPGAAESFSGNADNTSFTFKLRDGIEWSDENKTQVTAYDFAYGLKRAVAKETDCPGVQSLFCIKNARKIHAGESAELGVTAIDAKTLQIDLEYSYDDFPRVMSLPASMPCNQAFFESTNGKYGQEDKFIICNGPFKVKSKYGWDHGNKIYLSANDGYKGSYERIPASVEFTIGEDVSDLISAIDKGKVDAGELKNEQYSKATELQYNITAFEDTTYGICFNFSNDIFKNLNVRKSFLVSLDREYILKNIPDNCRVANDIIMDNDVVNGESYRKLSGSGLYLKQEENAVSYLKSGLKELGVNSLPSVCVICSDDEKTKSMVSCMIENWNNQLGYYFNMKPMSKDEIEKSIRLSDYQIAITSITSETDDPIDVLSMFVTNDNENPCDMKDSKYDAMVSAAADAPMNEKVEKYKKAEQYLNDVCAFYPLYYQDRYFASAKNVSSIIFYQHNSGVSFLKAQKTKK